MKFCSPFVRNLWATYVHLVSPGSPQATSILDADMFIQRGSVIYLLYRRGTTVSPWRVESGVVHWWGRFVSDGRIGKVSMEFLVCGAAEKWAWIKGNSGGNSCTHKHTCAHTHALHTQGSQWCGLHRLRRPSCRGPQLGWGGQEHYPPFVKERVGMSNKSHLPLYLWNDSLQCLASIRLDSENPSHLLVWPHIYSVLVHLETPAVQPLLPLSALHPSRHAVVSTKYLTYWGGWLNWLSILKLHVSQGTGEYLKKYL